jgi:hypothetical protein
VISSTFIEDPLAGDLTPGVARVCGWVRMQLAVGVAQACADQGFADRPRHRPRAAVLGRGRGRPVQVRGLVEVPGEQQRPASLEQGGRRRQQLLDRGGPDLVLGGEDLVHGYPASESVGSVLDVVEVRVDHGHRLTRPDLDERVEPLSLRGLEDWVLGQDLEPDVVVGVPGPLGDLGEPVVGLQHADDIGIEVGHHGVGRRAAAVLHVEDQQ